VSTVVAVESTAGASVATESTDSAGASVEVLPQLASTRLTPAMSRKRFILVYWFLGYYTASVNEVFGDK
jgi:hypothetical protein